MKRIRPARPLPIDKAILVAIATKALEEEPKATQPQGKAPTTRQVPDNGVGFLVGRTHHGKDTVYGPNGKRVTRVIYEDGTSQDI